MLTFWLAAAALAAQTTTATPLDGVSILIVDDETDARELLVAMLEDYGAEVCAVASAEAAIDALTGDSFNAQVLVSDVGMPGTDGFALLREIRRMPVDRLRNLPAIAVTAYANPDDRVRALVAGYQNHIPKPVDANALALAIAQLVARPTTLS